MTAILSPCGRYRYALGRHFRLDGFNKGLVLFVMLNPSTADAAQDDPTIRRCIGFAMAWGFRRLLVGNLFAYRATNPKDLPPAPERIGPENERHLCNMARRSSLIVCAWGSAGREGQHFMRDWLAGYATVMHLGLTRGGQPKHPLYLKASTEPQRWV